MAYDDCSGYSLVNSQATWMTPSCVTVATTSLILSVPNLANDATKITTLGPGVEIHANAVNVRWRRGDFDGSPRASPAETTAQTTADAPRSSSQNTEQSSSKTSANSSPSSSSSSIASQGQNNTTSQTSSSASPASTLSSITSSTASTSASAAPTDLPSGGGLSDGAKAGIGVGVVLAVAAIAALIILLLRKRRRQERAAPEPESPQMVHGNDQRFPPELRAGSQRQTGMQEVHAQSIPHEVDAHRVYQLDGAPMKRAELGSQSPAEMGSYKD